MRWGEVRTHKIQAGGGWVKLPHAPHTRLPQDRRRQASHTSTLVALLPDFCGHSQDVTWPVVLVTLLGASHMACCELSGGSSASCCVVSCCKRRHQRNAPHGVLLRVATEEVSLSPSVKTDVIQQEETLCPLFLAAICTQRENMCFHQVPLTYIFFSIFNKRKSNHLHLPFFIRLRRLCSFSCRIFQALFTTV